MRMLRMRSIVLAGVLLAAATASLEPAQGADGRPVRVAAGVTPADEIVGERPIELVRANRKPKRTPLVNFDSLEGWSVECLDGAHAQLYPSNEQRVWKSKTAKLIYRGTDESSTVILRPPAPLPIARQFDCVNLWLYGNNWGYSPDPKTPQVQVFLLVTDEAGQEHDIWLSQVKWRDWWQVHQRIDAETNDRLGANSELTGIKVTRCGNAEDRVLFFEDLALYQESLAPLRFAPRPKRGIDPFPDQSPGANTGPGRLPFPTREQTILPANFESRFSNQVTEQPDGSFRFSYRGADALLEYVLYPGQTDLGRVEVFLAGHRIATGLVGAGLQWEQSREQVQLTSASLQDGVVRLVWNSGAESHLRLWQKSLVVDFFCTGGKRRNSTTERSPG